MSGQQNMKIANVFFRVNFPLYGNISRFPKFANSPVVKDC